MLPALVLVLLGTLVALLVARGDASGIVPTGCSGSATLRISASAPVATVLGDLADDFDAWAEDVEGIPCTSTEISAASPQEFSTVLARALDGETDEAPTTWVPDSSLWATVLARDPRLAAVLPRTHAVVAASPVVFAAPRPMAEALGWPGEQPTWERLSTLANDPRGWAAAGHPEWGRLRLQWPNALTSTAGLGSTVAVYRDLAIGVDATDDLRRRLVTAHNAVGGSTGDLSVALGGLRTVSATDPAALREMPIVPATEQEVVRFNAAEPAVEVAAIYPPEGWVVSEVPVLGLRGDWVSDEQRAASEAFADFAVRGTAQAALQQAGWRAARLGAIATATSGVVPTEPRYTPAQPSQDVIARTLQNWTALDRRGSVLVVLDTSGSMKEEVGTTGRTRLDVAKSAILSSLPFFADEASVGLWTFSRADRGRDWVEVVPLGRLDRRIGAATARDGIATAVPRITAAGDTALHDTTLAAVAAVRAGWQPGPNTVVLISDGKNEDPGSPDLPATLQRLVDEADPSRPVEVVTIALGSAADARGLRNIATTTKGAAYVADRPEDLESVFLAALTG